MQFRLSLLAALISIVVATDPTTVTETVTYYPPPTTVTYYPPTTTLPPSTVTSTVTTTIAANCSTTSNPVPDCPPTSWTILLRRMWNGAKLDHFYSSNGPEIAQYGTQGYAEEPPAGRVYATQVAGTVPLWRLDCNTGTKIDHFYTADQGEFQASQAGGCTADAQPGMDRGVGYLYTSPQCGAVPLYRLFSGSRIDHFYTTNKAERDDLVGRGVYSDQGIAGYVIP